MELLLIGTNHRRSPAEVRDALYMEREAVARLLPGIRDGAGLIDEAVVLSTCNRTEMYVRVGDAERGADHLRRALADFKGTDHLANPDYTYLLSDREAATHLFRVAAGVDSLMVGEPQILGQVREAFEVALSCGVTGTYMDRLFQAAARAGKRARSETDIGRGAVSVAYAAVSMASKVFADLSRHTVLIVGAGETGSLAARHFADLGPGRMLVANRTAERAREVADELGGEAVSFDGLSGALAEADVVVSATSSPDPVITRKAVQQARRTRGRRALVLIDIAAPRDVEPQVGRLPNTFLYDLDALESIVQQSLEQRAREVPRVEKIVAEEVDRFFSWYDTLAVAPMIRALRGRFTEIGQEEVRRQTRHFADSDQEQVDRYTRSLLNKLLHNPTVLLREADPESSNGLALLDVVRELFDLDPAAFAGSDNGNGSGEPSEEGKE